LFPDFSNHSINASTKQAEVFSYYRIPGSSTFFNTPSLTFAAPSGIQNNTANIEFNQSAAGTLHLLTQQAFPPSPSKLWVSDNYFQQATTIYLDLACPEPSSPKNIALNMAASIVQFGVAAGNGFTAPDVALYSYQAPATCDVTGADASSLNGGSWSYPNPVNLSLGLSTPSITATEQKVCWDFTMSNPVTAGSTPAYNVFMQAPVLLPPYNTVLTNWELTFDYKGNSYSYPAPLQGGGIFTLFPTPPMPSAPDFNNLAAGVSMVQNGKLCAKYNECVKPDLDLTLNWGWNCTADYNSACLNNFAETLHVKPADPNIQLSAVIPPASVTLCSDNVISVQFKNMDAGTAYPTLVSFGNNTTGFTPVSVTAVNCNNSSASASLTLAYDANNHIIFPLTAGNLHDLGYATTASPGNDGMKQGDCIELQITFTPTCQFGTEMQMPDVELHYNPYCDINANPAVFTVYAPVNPVPISGTACTSCFKIEKWATPGSVTNGIEEVTYEIVVCGNNVPGTYDVDLTDNFPSGFTPTLDPFNGQTIQVNVPYNGCVSTFASGYLNGDACNHAEMSYTSAQSSILLQADTCVNLLPNCRDISDYVIQNAFTGDIAYQPGQTLNIVGTVTVPQNGSLSLSGLTIYFEPGAEILLQAGAQLRLDNCYLLACTKMYKGITLTENGFGAGVLSGSTLRMTDCSMQDAEYGVNLGMRSAAILTNNLFDNNYISVFYRWLPLGAGTRAMALMEGNIFLGTGALVLPYQGQLTVPLGNRPKAGIEAWRANVNLVPRRGMNSFIGLSNGIILQRSTLTIRESMFDDIQPDPVYDPITTGTFGVNYNGSGIYGFGFKTQCYIDQTGFGNDENHDPATFNNCKYGIFADRISLHSRDNVMTRMDYGYHSRLSGRLLAIGDNYIEANENAIDMLLYDLSVQMEIYRNNITFGNSFMPLYANYGIRAEGNYNGNDQHRINDNDINYTHSAMSAYGGVFSQSTSFLKIVNNRVYLRDNDINQFGIISKGGDQLLASCNVINSSTAPDGDKGRTQAAIAIEMGNDPVVSCNETDKTDNGLFVIGSVGGVNTSFRANSFNTHGNAFRYSTSGYTQNEQDFKGNLWLNQTPAASGFLARNENPNYNTNNYVYDVAFGNPIAYPPLTLQSPSGWFVQNLGTDEYCLPNHGSCEPLDFNLIDFIEGMDYEIAQGLIENDPYTEATQWMFKKDLYQRIAANSALLADSVLNAFYASTQNDAIAGIVPLEKERNMLFVTDSITDSLMVQHTANAVAYYSAIQTLLMDLDTAMTNNDSIAIENIKANIAAMSETAQTETALADSINGTVAANREAKAATLELANAGIAAGAAPDDNERAVNEIYLASIAREQYEFDSSQRETLYTIAQQCPMAGGPAVFRARALYALVDDKIMFDDFKICNSAGIQLKKAKDAAAGQGTFFKLYPNPANDKATLEYDISGTETVKFELMNATGQELIKVNLKGGKLSYTFSTKDLKPAVYHYRVIISSKGVENGKLIIVR
jgi:hypothetical protein